MPDDDEYTLNVMLSVKGYGNDEQAVATRERIRRLLNVVLHRGVNITASEIERAKEGDA